MYGLVPYNISPIQQAIQYGHAVQEYNNKMFEQLFKDKWKENFKKDDNFYAFQKWANEDKTFIILNGGTTNTKGDPRLGHGGTLNQHLFTLSDNEIGAVTFYEPDLGDQLTAVVFLVDERVWDYEKYPERNLNPGPESIDMGNGMYITPAIYITPESEEEYEKRLGGPKNVWLREFLKQFRLA